MLAKVKPREDGTPLLSSHLEGRSINPDVLIQIHWEAQDLIRQTKVLPGFPTATNNWPPSE